MKVAIMTDTNSGISPEEGKELGIFVVPMPLTVDGKDYSEGENITSAELYEHLRAHADASTSQPSPQVLCDKWDEIFGSGYDEIVVIPMSSGLSNTCETATSFAANYGGKIAVADNHRISVTLRESVNDAIKLAARGLSAAEIKARLEETAYRSSIYITVDTMEYLLKNGRATKAAAAIATAFNIKPVLTIQGGKLDAFKKVHGMKKSIAVMIDAVANDIKERFSDVPESRLKIGAAGTLDKQEDIDLWVSSLRRAFPNITVYYDPLSCSIACHVGVGAIGLGVSVTED